MLARLRTTLAMLVPRRRESQLDRIERSLLNIINEIKTMSTTVQQIKDDTTQQTTVIQSAVTMLTGFAAQLKTATDAAKAASDKDTADFAALDDLHAQLTANTSALAQAVAANTPATSAASSTPVTPGNTTPSTAPAAPSPTDGSTPTS